MKRSIQATVMSAAVVLGLAIALNGVTVSAQTAKKSAGPKIAVDGSGVAHFTLDAGIVGGWFDVADTANKTNTPLMQVAGASRSFKIETSRAPEVKEETQAENTGSADQFEISMYVNNNTAEKELATFQMYEMQLSAAFRKPVNGCNSSILAPYNNVLRRFSFLALPAKPLAANENCTTARVAQPNTKFYGPFSVE